jgi:predicted nucleotidyltransferase
MDTDNQTIQIKLPMDAIAAFCARWQITEFALFGSVLRDDFGPDSDIDVLVTFASESKWSLFDLVYMENELEHIFERKVDLASRAGVEESMNYIRRKAILKSARVIYVA